MYEAFYGLSEKPFNLTPDPRFLYLSAKHKEAFAHLLYGIRNRCGFVMVSGEIGTGKTTICRSLLKQLDPDTEVAFIFNPKLSPVELLQTINGDFGIASKAETVRGLIDELNAHLLDRASKGKNCVLIIDEAQNLGTETLEQIRLLSNLETETEKLLQIVLIGQPELAQKLELNELRQLNQRITARYHLGTLSGEETLHYIAFRLRVAGGRKKVKFTRNAVRAVHRISGGTPRVINALCDRALLIGYTKETRNISPGIVRKSAAEIQGAARPGNRPGAFRRFAPATLVAAAAVLAAGFFVWTPLRDAGWSLPWEREAKQEDPSSKPSVSPLAKETSGVALPKDDLMHTAPAPAVPQTTPPAPAPSHGIAEAASIPSADALVSSEPLAPPPIETPAAATSAAPLTETAPSATPPADKLASLLAPVSAPVSESPASVAPEVVAPVPTGPQPHRGLAELVRAWNLAILQTPPVDVTWSSVANFAQANGLRMLGMSPSSGQISTIDLPVLVRLHAGNDLEWAALIELTKDKVKLVRGDGRNEELPLESFRRDYAGDALYLWNDPTPKAEPLRAMVKSDAVTALQKDLQALGLLDRDPNGTYDAATIEAVGRVQRATGIAVDGVAGPQTRMVLSSWLDRSGAPNLSPTGFDDALRKRVLATPGMVHPSSSPPQEPESIPLPETLPVSEPTPSTNEAAPQ